MKYEYAVIGGDERQCYLASILAKNHNVIVFGLPLVSKELVSQDVIVGNSFEDTIQNASCILMPTPFSKDNQTIYCSSGEYEIQALLQTMTTKQKLYGGAVSREWKLLARRLQIQLTDYMDIDEIAWKNAVATAEGTLAEAIRSYPDNIQGAKCVILGFGRCGMIVANLFQNVGADVTVCVRRQEVMCKGRCLGFDMQSLEFLKQPDLVSHIDMIINTIPSRILKEEILTRLPPKCMIIDIVGLGGGTDFEKAKELGIKAYQCLGLPGKYAPRTSAQILADFIESNSK